MAGYLKFLILLCLIAFVFSKELHTKQTLEAKDKDAKGYINLFNNQDFLTNINQRIARHVKTVTESVLEHLFNEIKQQYFSSSYNPNSPIPRLIKNLNQELKRNERNKLLKEKEKRKNANKNKTRNRGKKKLRATTAKTILL